ncbi:MAG TPA: hypothetical protein VMV81_03510 [Phycisphaerae bacterium]|nr:hypothetical protein [Phycisphaerae bacterium]
MTAWLGAQVFALSALAILGWLLARLVWLYYFFGLFFFLVAGLLVGSIAFRIARSARPMEPGRLLRGIISIGVCSTVIIIVWEYRHYCATVGRPPHFAEARNAAIAAGKPPAEIQQTASDEFSGYLAKHFPPGGAMGYILWSTKDGTARITVGDASENIVNEHRHWIWPTRTLAGMILLMAGLWFSMESLRRPLPVSNVLQPGEEYEEAV